MEYHLVVLLGFKAVATATGIVLLVVGQWFADRAYDQGVNDDNDNEHSKTTTTKTVFYRTMPSTDPATTAAQNEEEEEPFWKQITWHDIITNIRTSVVARWYKLSLLGWCILAWASLLDRTTYTVRFVHNNNNKTTTSNSMIWLSLLFLTLAIVHTILLPKAISLHQVTRHETLIRTSMTALYLLTALVMSQQQQQQPYNSNDYYASNYNNNHTKNQNNDVPLWMPIVGAMALSASPAVMWRERQRGAAYEQNQKRQQHAIHNNNNAPPTTTTTTTISVFGWGGPLLVVGWTAWWFALNVTHAHPNRWYLPLYSNSSSNGSVALLGAMAVLTVVWMAGYAMDQWTKEASGSCSGSSKSRVDNNIPDLESAKTQDLPALGLCGKNLAFVHVTHVKFVLVMAWAIWSLAPLLPYTVGYAPWLLTSLTLIQGILWSVIYEKAILTGNQLQLQLYTKLAVVFALWWWVQLTVMLMSTSNKHQQQHGVVAVVALAGIVLVATGLYCLMQDRHTEMTTMTNDSSSQDATVTKTKTKSLKQHQEHASMLYYSHGAILVPAGMCCLAYAMSCV